MNISRCRRRQMSDVEEDTCFANDGNKRTIVDPAASAFPPVLLVIERRHATRAAKRFALVIPTPKRREKCPEHHGQGL